MAESWWVHGKRGINWRTIEVTKGGDVPKLAFPGDDFLSVFEVVGKVINLEREADLVDFWMFLEGALEVMQCVEGAILCRHNIGIGYDEIPVVANFRH